MIDFDSLEAYVKSETGTSRRLYSGSFEDLTEVLQREHAITTAADPKPVLATHSVGPCVGIVGWGKNTGVGFLAHYDALTDLPASLRELLILIRLGFRRRSDDFAVTLLTNSPDQNEKPRNYIKATLSTVQFMHVEITEDYSPRRTSKTIGLDTRTGEIFSYDPLKNPLHRTDLISGDRVRIPSKARLIYTPR